LRRDPKGSAHPLSYNVGRLVDRKKALKKKNQRQDEKEEHEQ